jgi:hypothetical protein
MFVQRERQQQEHKHATMRAHKTHVSTYFLTLVSQDLQPPDTVETCEIVQLLVGCLPVETILATTQFRQRPIRQIAELSFFWRYLGVSDAASADV